MARFARDSFGGRDCGSRDIICVASSNVSGIGRLADCLLKNQRCSSTVWSYLVNISAQ